MKTQEYSQPKFYHFSQSVIEAAQWISHYLKKFNPQDNNLVELFAGSGVMSLEIIHRLPNFFIKSWRLVELQNEFEPHLIVNTHSIHNLKPDIMIKDGIVWMQLFNKQMIKNSVIILNPPHYFEEEGRLALDKNKSQCMAISALEWEKFIEECRQSKNKIFMLLNNQTQLYRYTKKKLNLKIKIIHQLAGRDCLLFIN